jgi:hypothetical protein
MSKPWKLAYHKRTTTTGKGKHSSRKRGKKKADKMKRSGGYIPSHTTLAASADGTGHLHELFLVHGGGDGDARTKLSRTQGRKHSERDNPSLGLLSPMIHPGHPRFPLCDLPPGWW